jgi:hypothetical protein
MKDLLVILENELTKDLLVILENELTKDLLVILELTIKFNREVKLLKKLLL